MNKKGGLIIGGFVSLGALGAWIYFTHQSGGNDHDAAQFMDALGRKLNPSKGDLAKSDAFDMYYWKNVQKQLKKPLYMLTQNVAQFDAKQIHDAWGFFKNNTDQVYGVFRALKDQVAVSQVAYWYYIKFNVNLIDDLEKQMDVKKEVSQIIAIVDKLPPYRIP